MKLLLSIDAGTTSVKAGIFTPNGESLAIERVEYTIDIPQPGYAELDPEIYWRASVQAVRQAVSHSGADVKQITAVTVSSQGETVIPVDKRGHPLHPAILWLDNRAIDEASWLQEQIGKRAYDIAGIPEISPTWTACKILWLKNHFHEMFENTHKFLLVQDWLVYRLTGQFVTDGSISCTTLLMDISRNLWWQDSLGILDLPDRLLCEIYDQGAIAGQLTRAAAEQMGLVPKTSVVLGGMDQAVGAIGAGNYSPGIISETTGAALAIQITIPRPDIDHSRRISVNIHSAPGMYLFQPFCPTAGLALQWFRDVFGEPEISTASLQGKDAYDVLTDMAALASPGCDGLLMLPHLSGSLTPIVNSAARGVFSGFSLAHQKSHFVRAILEAVAFMLRRNLEVAVSSGIEVYEIRTSGGGARSKLWNQIKADVCNIPVVSLASEEAALLGDAILGGVATGVFASLEEGVKQMVALADMTNPGPNQVTYDGLYARYCDLDDTLDQYFRR